MKTRSTTICCVKKDGQIAMAGDGQVSTGQTIMKGNAVKVRKIFDDKIMTGFAGATADAMTLLELFEAKLQSFSGNLMRAAVELAKDWRTDKILRRLEALMIVADTKTVLLITGNGDVIEPEDGLLAIGSGGNYALAAARAMLKHSKMTAEQVAKEALMIASEICVYTNSNIVVETLSSE